MILNYKAVLKIKLSGDCERCLNDMLCNEHNDIFTFLMEVNN